MTDFKVAVGLALGMAVTSTDGLIINLVGIGTTAGLVLAGITPLVKNPAANTATTTTIAIIALMNVFPFVVIFMVHPSFNNIVPHL